MTDKLKYRLLTGRKSLPFEPWPTTIICRIVIAA